MREFGNSSFLTMDRVVRFSCIKFSRDRPGGGENFSYIIKNSTFSSALLLTKVTAFSC